MHPAPHKSGVLLASELPTGSTPPTEVHRLLCESTLRGTRFLVFPAARQLWLARDPEMQENLTVTNSRPVDVFVLVRYEEGT